MKNSNLKVKSVATCIVLLLLVHLLSLLLYSLLSFPFLVHPRLLFTPFPPRSTVVRVTKFLHVRKLERFCQKSREKKREKERDPLFAAAHINSDQGTLSCRYFSDLVPTLSKRGNVIMVTAAEHDSRFLTCPSARETEREKKATFLFLPYRDVSERKEGKKNRDERNRYLFYLET